MFYSTRARQAGVINGIDRARISGFTGFWLYLRCVFGGRGVYDLTYGTCKSNYPKLVPLHLEFIWGDSLFLVPSFTPFLPFRKMKRFSFCFEYYGNCVRLKKCVLAIKKKVKLIIAWFLQFSHWLQNYTQKPNV